MFLIQNYIIIDETNMDVKILYDKRFLDPVSDYYYVQYVINVSIDDDNYDCLFYYNDYGNFFLSPDSASTPSSISTTNFRVVLGHVRIFENILEVDYELCTSYQDLKTLLLETKILPILYREKIAHMANDKWFMLH